ncbi:MAG: Uma2 family endonuclease [Candidatus Sumerlaeota bacterium]|nr:Uma2 family endonuclease [Candidatus Sumerlaeota bacterium]
MEDFWQFASKSDYWGELIEGEVYELTPPGIEHGRINSQLNYELRKFAKKNKLGEVLCDCGFVLFQKPDTVRAPDIAFIRADRWAEAQSKKFSDVPPDLAVEIVSPWDTHTSLVSKARMFLKAGVEEVWIVDSDTKTVEILRAPHEIRLLGEEEIIETPLLPGLKLPVREIFE